MPNLLGHEIESVTSSQLRQGDTVIAHGMVIKLDRPMQTYRNGGQEVYWTAGLVTNPEDIRPDAIAGSGDPLLWSFLHDMAGQWNGVTKQWERVYTGRWTVQGSDLARWARVLPNAE